MPYAVTVWSALKTLRVLGLGLLAQEGHASIDLPLGDQLDTHSPVAWFAADYLIMRRILHD